MMESDTHTTPDQTILVIDDSKVIRKAINTILSDQYSIVEAVNGEKALDYLNNNPDIHAILLDLWMPDVDGFEVLEFLRDSSVKRLNKIPVIVVTGHEDDQEMRSRALTLGAIEFIGKPFSAEELREMVKQHILPVKDSTILPFQQTPTIEAEALVVPSTIVPPKSEDNEKRLTVQKIRQSREKHLIREGKILLERAESEHRPLSLLILRMDNVKTVRSQTDTEFTKRTLYQISKLIEGEVRRKDSIVRLSATEIAIVLPNTSSDEASALASAVFRMLRLKAFTFEGLTFRITASAGQISTNPSSRSNFGDLFKTAEAYANQAYLNGGDQIVSGDEPLADTSNAVLSLDDAATMLREGKTRQVNEQLSILVERSLPLLIYTNSVQRLGVESMLRKLISLTKDDAA